MSSRQYRPGPPSLMSTCLLIAAAAVACKTSTPAPPPNTPPPPKEAEPEIPEGPLEAEPLETGKDCATAEAICEGGVCTAKVMNKCDAPVTCSLSILALCQGGTDRGEARGKERDTIPAGSETEIQAGADCEGAAVMGTQVEQLTCQ